MFLYAAALILEFAALIWLRIKNPEMQRPYRIPFGATGVIAISLPPIALCLASIALSNDATRFVGVGAIVLGLIVFRWQSKASATAEGEPAPTL
jgi:amino acid transporter